MEEVTGPASGVLWLLAVWVGALISWACTAKRATRAQRALRAASLVLALTTLAQGAGLPIVLLLMLSIALAALARWKVDGARYEIGMAAARPPEDDGPRSR